MRPPLTHHAGSWPLPEELFRVETEGAHFARL
jgi:hypothetical protein